MPEPDFPAAERQIPGPQPQSAEGAAARPAPGFSDAEARRSALNPAQSWVVESPAGAGKTELLIQRYLCLLAQVDRPERVLAITFTRKAAGEIRQRVFKALDPRAAASLQPATAEYAGQVRRKNWDLERMPAQLRIQTIDAFCAALAQSLPWQARLGGVLQPMEGEPAQQACYRLAARRLISRVRESGPLAGEVQKLLLHFDNQVDRLEQRLVAMLERRDQWQRWLGVPSTPDDLQAFRAGMEAAWREHIEAQLQRLAAALGPADAGLCFACMQIAAARLGRQIDAMPPAAAGALPVWNKFANLLLIKEGDWRKAWTINDGLQREDRQQKQLLTSLVAMLKVRKGTQSAVRNVQILPNVRVREEIWEVLQSLLRLLPYAAAELKLIWAEAGAVDFIEMAQAATHALGELDAPTDLEIALDDRIQHILIDEFQDTSIAQLLLLRRLTANWQAGDGRTLFVVGDPKQSIYGWRQAEVGLFVGIERLLPALKLQRLQLRANFRSDSGLVEWVNAAYPGVFERDCGPLPHEVAFSASEPVKHFRLGSRVLPLPAFYDRSASPRAVPGEVRLREAQAVVRQIQSLRELLAQDPEARDGAPATADQPARIAVLVRAREHARAIVAEMRRQKVLFQAVSLAPLGDSQVVQDLRALARALAYPADRTAWLAVLRAPWCGLTLEDLHRLAAEDPEAPVWELLRTRSLAGEARARVERVLPVLEQALGQRCAYGLRRAVEAAWLRLGGPACLPQDEQSQAQLPEQLQAFWNLLQEYEAGGELRDRTAWEEQLQNLMAPPAELKGPLVTVQIMTLHAAKGLEFEAVVLPALDRLPGRNAESEPPMAWVNLDPGVDGSVLLGMEPARGGESDPQHEYLKRLRQSRRREEDKRLLYVAATRAIRYLVISACVGMKNGTVCDPPASSLLHLLWPAVRPGWIALAAPPAPAPAAAAAPPRHPPLHRLRLGWVPPAPPSMLAAAAPPAAVALAPLSFDWVGETLRLVGVVVHAWLMRIQRDGLDRWSEERISRLLPRLRADLIAAGVADAELDAAIASARHALVTTLQDPRGRWLLGGHPEDRSEWELSGMLGGSLIQVRIDRSFVDAESGERWIVDYKTSRHAGGGLDRFFAEEIERHRGQLQRYAALVGKLDPRPIRLGLYYPLLGAWREVD